MNIPTQELQSEFTYEVAIPFEEGVTRRDPSPVIRLGGTYYVYYSKATVDASGYFASVWFATSPDGRIWTEQAEAVPKGGPGTWDENGVFTPTTLLADAKVYVFYTAVPTPFNNKGNDVTPTAIGVAVADRPEGPFEKFGGNPVLRPSPEPAKFDSMRVDDACLIVRGGRYWLYYKGRQKYHTPGETKMGLAIAEAPTGPYIKHEANPVLDSGHEVCVWPHRNGVAALVSGVGPQGNTSQWSPDGVLFRKAADIKPPSAPGPFRADAYRDADWGAGITWGLSQCGRETPRPYLLRFECDLRAPERR